MSETPVKLPYRKSVGIMLVNSTGDVWVGRRVPKWRSKFIWQMPQGGIMEGEKPRQAALRELEEEIGTRNVKILGKSSRWLKYDLPNRLLGVALGGKYRGHKYKWFVMQLCGTDDEINIARKQGLKAEFDDWRWVDIHEIENLGVSFKEQLYQRVVKELGPHISGLGHTPPRKCA